MLTPHKRNRYLYYEHNQVNLTFLWVDWTRIIGKKRNNLRKSGLRREYCSRDQENCSNCGSFPITEIRIIESNL